MGNYVSLSGSLREGDGEIRYQWTQASGVPVTIDGAQGLNAGFRAPAGLDADVLLTFRLTATGPDGSTSDTVQITVRAGGQADPTIVLGTASPGEQIRLQLPQFLLAPGETSIEWLQVAGTGVSLSDSQGASPSFAAPQLFVGENLEFEVTTTNGSEVQHHRVRIRIDPVEAVARQGVSLTSWQPGDEVHHSDDSQQDGARGIGRIWAAFAIFLTGWFQRPKDRS
jgi:hypothetical protein